MGRHVVPPTLSSGRRDTALDTARDIARDIAHDTLDVARDVGDVARGRPPAPVATLAGEDSELVLGILRRMQDAQVPPLDEVPVR